MQHFDFTLPVNGAREIHVQGSYVYYLAGSAGGADDTIVLKNVEGSDEVILRPGQSFDIGAGEKFVRWNLSNYKNQGTIAGRLLMGSGTFSDNRISGSVEVIDGGKNRTNAGNAFTAHVYAAPTAAMYSGGLLWNPAGSGKNIVIPKMIGAIGGGYLLQIGHLNAIPAGAVAQVTGSKKSGGALSVATAHSVVQAGLVVTNANAIFAMYAGEHAFAEPFVIAPGYGFAFGAPVVNNSAGAELEFFEEAI